MLRCFGVLVTTTGNRVPGVPPGQAHVVRGGGVDANGAGGIRHRTDRGIGKGVVDDLHAQHELHAVEERLQGG